MKSAWVTRRQKPYTEIGIRRIPCIRCGCPGKFQWCICADGNNYRAICATCDIQLNALVLEWMGCPPEYMTQTMLDYVKYVTGEQNDQNKS